MFDSSSSITGGIYQLCLLTALKQINCSKNAKAIWPSRGVRTFLDTRLAVGLLGQRTGYGPLHPTVVHNS